MTTAHVKGIGRVTSALNRHPAAVLILLVALVAATTISSSTAKPLWHDEIYTVLLARLSAADLWTATRTGVDLSPPLNTLLTKAAAAVAGTSSTALRLPPLIGFWIAIGVVFEYVRRRSNVTMASGTALLLCFTAGFRYSYEARGYGVMMGLAAVVLFAWAEAAAGRRRRLFLPVLAIALAAGYWTQYYAVFAIAPIAAGEIVRAVRARRVDGGLWGAVALSVLAVVPLVPLMRAAATQAPSFWRHTSLADVPVTYAYIFGSLVERPLLLAAVLAIAVAAIARMSSAGTIPGAPVDLPHWEVAALTVCVLLPMMQVLAALATTGAFVPRYALGAVPGFCIAAGMAMAWISRKSHAAQLIWTAILIWTLIATVPIRFARVNPVRQRPVLARLLAQGEPVVVTGGLMYLQLWYYSAPAMAERLRFLADPELAVGYTGSDTIDRGLIGLARWFDVGTVPPPEFTTAHPEFHVYAAGSGWLLAWLADNHASMVEEGRELGAPILRVRVAP